METRGTYAVGDTKATRGTAAAPAAAGGTGAAGGTATTTGGTAAAPAAYHTDSLFALIVAAALALGFASLAVRMGVRVLMKAGVASQRVVNAVFFDNPLMKEDFANRNGVQAGLPASLAAVNWKELYPLSEETEAFYEGTIDSRESTDTMSFVLQLSKAAAAIAQVNTWLNENFVCRYSFIEAVRQIQKPLGFTYLASVDENGRWTGKLPNGHFTKFYEKVDESQVAASLIRFSEFLSQRGIPLLYVQAPYKVDPADKTISGLLDFSNQNADELLSLIDGKVDWLDLRAEIKKEGINHYECFYRTDSHWKVETGLWATRVIAQKLNESYHLGLDSELLTPKNFNFKLFPKSYFGGYGGVVALADAEKEDFTLVTPKNEFSLDVELYTTTDLIRKASGGFELFLFPEMIQTEATLYDRGNGYFAYLLATLNAFVTNNSAQNDLNILFFGDSFTAITRSFLSLCVKNSDTFNCDVFDGSLSAFIDAHEKYDVCIMQVTGSTITDAPRFFDFR